MRIPDIEMQKLYDWSQAELSRIKSAHPEVRGALGGNIGKANKIHFAEYNRRLLELKSKYEHEDTIANPRTFNELLQHA